MRWSAHSFVQAYEDEAAAFDAFARDHGGNSVLLVDTYDTIEGVRVAIETGRLMRECGDELTGIRLDSGDLADLAIRSRAMLDDAGFADAVIYASGGVDEHDIAALLAAGAPIDGFGAGTSLTVPRDRPASDIAYKLVGYDGQPRVRSGASLDRPPWRRVGDRRVGPRSPHRAGRRAARLRTDDPSPGGHRRGGLTVGV